MASRVSQVASEAIRRRATLDEKRSEAIKLRVKKFKKKKNLGLPIWSKATDQQATISKSVCRLGTDKMRPRL